MKTHKYGNMNLSSLQSPAAMGILAALEQGDMIKKELAPLVGIAYSTIQAQSFCERLRDEGKIHICGWRRRAGPGWPDPIWRLGPGVDAPKPKPLSNAKKARTMRGRSKARLKDRVKRIKRDRILTATEQKILDAIVSSRKPICAADIADVTGVPETTMVKSGYLRILKAAGLIRIGRYRRSLWSSGPPVPYFIQADGEEDAEKPRPMTAAAKSKRWKARTGYDDKRKAMRSENPVALIDPIMAALTGGKL